MAKDPQRTSDTVVRVELAAIIGLLLFPIYDDLGEFLQKFLKGRSKNNGKNGEKNNKNGEKNNKNSGNSIW